jgi:hypothetical protein
MPHTPHHRTGPWRCGSCSSPFVHPVQAAAVAGDSWQIDLRCAECEAWTSRICDAADTDDLDRELDRASDEIAAELSRMVRVHMEEWADRFLNALRLDLIGPDDFRPWLH